MTIKMPSLDGLPSIITDERGSTGVFPILRRPLRVQYSADTVDVTLPDHVSPIPYDGGDGQLDEVLNRHVLFTDTEGNFWSIEQSRLQFLQTLSATFYVMFRRTARGWKRWQPRLGPPAPPLSGITGICFRNGATIQLVAGGTVDAAFDSFSPTDGPLGTNVITGPYAVAFNPLDGLVYFNDNSVNLRTWSPTSGLVATAVHSQPFWNGEYWLEFNSSIAFASDGTCYQWGIQDDDEPQVGLIVLNPDGTFATSLVGGNHDIYNGGGGAFKNVQITGIGGVAVSRTGATRVFIGIRGSISDGIAQDGDSAVDNGTNVSFVGYFDYNTNHDDDDNAGHVVFVGGVYFPAGNNSGAGGPTNYPSPTTSGDGSAPLGTSSTDQGEGTGVEQPLIGQIDDLCLSPGDDIFTVAYDVHMVRKMTSVRGSYDGAVSLTNHTAIDFEGGNPVLPNPGGYAGDGLPAYTAPGLTTSPQFGGPNSVAMSDCGGPVILDGGTVRYIDPAGNLFTVAGDPTGASPFPDTTPADALTRSFSGAKITQIGRGRYIISQVGNDSTDPPTPDALYLLIDKQCMTPTPTIRLVAGQQPSDEDGHQIDGVLGTNSVEGVLQMCWGPDGKIWLAGAGSSPDFTTNVRTYDPITGLVATTPFHSTFGDRGRINGICCSAAGNVYFIVNSTDDEDTTYLCKIPFGATSQSDVTEIFFFSEFGGSASLVRNLGVVTNNDGKEFVIVEHTSFSQIYYVDVDEGTASDSIIGDPGYGSVDADNPEMGEDVNGTDGSLGDTLKGLYVVGIGFNVYQVVTSSVNNQVIRSCRIFFEDDGDGGTIPQAFDLFSVTSHSLYPSGDPAGYGGDEEPALVPGDYGPRFNGLDAVAVDQCGNYYTIDYNNYVVRMVDTQGILHTIAGNNHSAFDDGQTFPTVDPVLATTVNVGIDIGNGGALLPDPNGGVYLACGNALYKLES